MQPAAAYGVGTFSKCRRKDERMRLPALSLGLVVSLALSLVLSMLTHTFVLLAFLPFLFFPVVFRRRRR